MNSNMINRLRSWITRLFKATATPEQLKSHKVTEGVEVSHQTHAIPYDENLLVRARAQWQFCDWQSLAQLSRDSLQDHPDRAELALLAAVGRLQTKQFDDARQYIRLAKDWGVKKNLLNGILVAGIHNSLGRAATIAGEQPRALKHFQASILSCTPVSEARLLVHEKICHRCQQIDLLLAPNGALTNTDPSSPNILTH